MKQISKNRKISQRSSSSNISSSRVRRAHPRKFQIHLARSHMSHQSSTTPAHHPTKILKRPDLFQTDLFINGQFVPALDGKTDAVCFIC